MRPVYWTIFLLLLSNVFMTFAWYGHLKLQEMGKIRPPARTQYQALVYCRPGQLGHCAV